jgi:hypothetical protein
VVVVSVLALGVVLATGRLSPFAGLEWLRAFSFADGADGANIANTPVAQSSNGRHAPSAARPDAFARLGITAFPREARATVNGTRLPENPYVLEVAPGSGRLDIRVEAPGYLPQARELVVERSGELVFQLVPDPSTGAVNVAPAQPAAPPARSHTDRCSVPYRFDERGIKRYDANCL